MAMACDCCTAITQKCIFRHTFRMFKKILILNSDWPTCIFWCVEYVTLAANKSKHYYIQKLDVLTNMVGVNPGHGCVVSHGWCNLSRVSVASVRLLAASHRSGPRLPSPAHPSSHISNQTLSRVRPDAGRLRAARLSTSPQDTLAFL